MSNRKLKFGIKVTNDTGTESRIVKRGKSREALEKVAEGVMEVAELVGGGGLIEVVELETPEATPTRKALLAEILVEVEKLTNLTREAATPRLARLLGEACLVLATRATQGQVELLVQLSAGVLLKEDQE